MLVLFDQLLQSRVRVGLPADIVIRRDPPEQAPPLVGFLLVLRQRGLGITLPEQRERDPVVLSDAVGREVEDDAVLGDRLVASSRVAELQGQVRAGAGRHGGAEDDLLLQRPPTLQVAEV